jgi:hypothetical protein
MNDQHSDDFLVLYGLIGSVVALGNLALQLALTFLN